MDFFQLITPLLFRLPLFLLWLVGMVIAVIRWKKHSRTSLMTIIGCVVLTISSFLQTIIPSIFPVLAEQSFDNGWLIDVYFLVMRLLPFVDLIGWIFVLIAIFGERKQINTSQETPA